MGRLGVAARMVDAAAVANVEARKERRFMDGADASGGSGSEKVKMKRTAVTRSFPKMTSF